MAWIPVASKSLEVWWKNFCQAQGFGNDVRNWE